MKKRIHLSLAFGILLGILAACMVLPCPRPVQAAVSFQEIPTGGVPDARKIGDCSFVRDANNHLFFKGASAAAFSYADTASSGSTAFTDGSVIYYVAGKTDGQWLARCTVSDKTITLLKKMPGTASAHDAWFSLRAMAGNILYVNYANYDTGKVCSYTYDLSSEAWKKQVSGVQVIAASGTSALVEHGLRSDVSPFKMSLYKYSSGKLKKVKTLGKYCFGGAISGKYVYYAVFPDAAMSSAHVYRIKTNGKGRKSLGKITYRISYLYNFTPKYFDINSSGMRYRYTYKTTMLRPLP